MSLSRKLVEKISLLARLDLSDHELDHMTGQLDEIVRYVDLLSELPTDDIEPMAHALDLSNVFAADQLGTSLDRNDALANAPDHDGECYLVPAVLEEN